MGRDAAIGHLDADCFYVSAERLRAGFLAGKPVGVLGNHGACVIAKSYEMKAAGVRTGEPVWEAKKKCPEGVYVKRDFRWYEAVSRRMLEVVRRHSPRVEFYSIDEFFFEVVPRPGQSFAETAAFLRDAIKSEVGVPVTVSFARTKTLAKLISDTAKPFGARVVLDRAAEVELLARLPVTEVSGIAGRRAARLAPYGIVTCLDLRGAERLLIRGLLTRAGEALWYELNGEPVLPLHTERPPHKMLSRGGSLGETTSDPARLWAWAVRHLERLIEELEYHRVRTDTLSVWVGYPHGRTGLGVGRLATPSNDFFQLLDAARQGLRSALVPGARVHRLHLIACRLTGPGVTQQGLFDAADERAATIAELKREVNDACGRFALRSGATLPLADVYRDEANGYDICDVRGKLCF